MRPKLFPLPSTVPASLASLFRSNSALTSVPDTLLINCGHVTSLANSFLSSGLTSLGEGFFTYTKNVTNYGGTLNGVKNLALPSVLFDLPSLSKVTTMAFFLYQNTTGDSATGTIQDIWNYERQFPYK